MQPSHNKNKAYRTYSRYQSIASAPRYLFERDGVIYEYNESS